MRGVLVLANVVFEKNVFNKAASIAGARFATVSLARSGCMSSKTVKRLMRRRTMVAGIRTILRTIA
jgi:hypothetical protein